MTSSADSSSGSSSGGGGACPADPPIAACMGAVGRGAPQYIAGGSPEPFGGGTFIIEPDGGGVQCDPWAQDCPDGEKCMPWADDGGGSWNALRCSPLDNNPNAVGDPCTVQGTGVSGIDDCDLGAMCFFVDPMTNEGTCIEMCSCSPDNPVCMTAGTTCLQANQGVLNICLEVCNPDDPTGCDDGQLCQTSSGADYPVCSLDADPDNSAVAGDPCEFANICDAGHLCAIPEDVPGCPAVGCCSAFCEVGDNSGCLPGQECAPFYPAGSEPDACLADLGACIVP